MDFDSDPELKQMREEFIQSFAERRSLLAPVLTELKGAQPSEQTVKQLQFISHKLAGAAASYGFPSLTRVGSCLDDLLDHWDPKTSKIQPRDLFKLAEKLDQMMAWAFQEKQDPAGLTSDVEALLAAATHESA